MDGGWTSDDRAENHWRRTFCQIPFTDIYEHADKGKRSLHGLVAFFRRKAHAERSASEELRELLHDQVQAEASSLEDLEESGTSIRKALAEVKSFVDATCNHQLLLAKVLEEQVAEPLESLQEASEMYIRILRDEIKNVNDEYAAASSAHKQASTRLHKAMEDLSEAKERQRIALHGIGVPEFELQRLSARVSKCEDEKLQAEMVKAQAKNALYNRIIARDEMAMAVSVAYQKAEEERLDQLKSSLQRFLHVEKDRLKVAEKMLASLEQHIGHIDRSEDIQLLIHNRRNPDNMHFQGKALALLDWHWGKMQTEQAQTRRRGHSIENGVYDASSAESESSTVTTKTMTGRGGDGTSSFVRSSSMSTISAEPVVIPPPPHTTTGAGGDSMKPPPSPHGELAQTPMGLALRRYFANDSSVAPVMQTLRDVSIDDSQKQEQQQHIISKSTAAASATEADLGNSLENESLSDAVTAASPPNSSQAESSEDDNANASNQTVAPPTLPRSNSSSLNSGVVKSSCVNQSGRAMFVKCLNRQRSLETKIKDQGSFDELVDCFNVFLSECIRGDDVKAAKTAMILAETFYLPKPAKQRSTSSSSEQSATDSADHSDPFEHNHFHHHGGVNRGATRMYLQEEVKKHAIWKNPAFWEKALLLAIGEELQKTPQQAPWEDLPSGVPKHDGIPSREEAVGRVHNIVFGQLGSFTLSMLEFEVPLPQIESFVETMCDAHELTEDQRFLLRKNLHEIFATL